MMVTSTCSRIKMMKAKTNVPITHHQPSPIAPRWIFQDLLILLLAPVLTLALVACGDGGQSVDYDGTWNCKMGFPKTGSISFTVTGSQVTVNISHAGACDVSGKIEGNGFDLERWISGFGDLGHCEARGVFRDADHCDITRYKGTLSASPQGGTEGLIPRDL